MREHLAADLEACKFLSKRKGEKINTEQSNGERVEEVEAKA